MCQLFGQLPLLQSLADLSPAATIKERIAIREKLTTAFRETKDLQEKLQLAKAYEQIAITRQDSILLGHSYAQLQDIYIALDDPVQQKIYLKKQKEIDSNFGFLLADLSNNYQYLYTHLKVFPEQDKPLTIEEVRSNDFLFEENTSKENFDPDQTYWAKLILKGDPDRTKKGLLFIEGELSGFSWEYIDIWFIHANNQIIHQKAGLAVTPQEKSNPTHLNFGTFQVAPNEQVIVYVRVEKAERHRANRKLGFGILKDERGDDAPYQFQNKVFSQSSVYTPFKSNLITSHTFYEDPTGTASFDEIVANWEQLDRKDVFSIQHQTEQVYWVKQRFVGTTDFQGEQMFYFNYYLGVDYFCFDYMDTYIVDSEGKVTHQRAGDHVSLSDRPYYFWANLIKLDINPSDTLDMYVRLEGADWRFLMPFMGLWHIDKSFWPEQTKKATREGFFYGILFIQCLFSLLLFSIGRERIYLYLSILILGLFLAFGFLIDDSSHFVLFPTFRDWQVPISFIGQFLVVFGMLQFTKTYFGYPKESIFVKYVIPVYLLVFGVVILSVIYGAELWHFDFYFNSGMILVALAIAIIWWVAYRSKPDRGISKKFYFAAFAPVGLSFLLFAINLLGPRIFGVSWLSFIDLSTAYYLVKMSIILMLMLLALSTGHRTNQLKKEKALVLQQTLADQQRVNKSISRFVPNEFLQALGKNNITQITLGDHIEKVVTVFFADIRGYTTLAEQMKPQENFNFVNAFNGRLGPIIQNNNGFVNQYLGDGIMAIFSQSSTDALRSAVQMQQSLQAYNKERLAKKRRPIKVGMGMHTGSLIMGIIGDTNRMDPATVSDVVNTASRIENLTKFYGTSILLSESSKHDISAKGLFNFRYLGQVQVKGKQQSIKIYECYDGDEPEVLVLKKETQAAFEKGIQLYFDKSFSKAVTVLTTIVQQNPADLPAALYLKKAKALAKEGVGDDWTGVEMMLFK